MTTNLTNQTLILRESRTSFRLYGIYFLIVGLGLILFYWYSPKVFGIQDSLTFIILSLVIGIAGVTLLIPATLMLITKNQEIIFDNLHQKIYLNQKGFFSQHQREYFYRDITGFSQETSKLEDQTYFENFIILDNSKIQIPSSHKTNKNQQDQQLQEVKEFIKMMKPF